MLIAVITDVEGTGEERRRRRGGGEEASVLVTGGRQRTAGSPEVLLRPEDHDNAVLHHEHLGLRGNQQVGGLPLLLLLLLVLI